MARNTFKLGLVQHACTPGVDAAAKRPNLDTACRMIREAAARGAQLIATQELFTSVYFPQVEDEARFELAEPIPGPTSDRLCELAGELGVEITASLFEKRAPGVYHNTSVMIGPAGATALGTAAGGGAAPVEGGRARILSTYRKMHIPDDPRFYEKYYFTPGDAAGSGDAAGFHAQRTAHATTGMLVCWDQWFPEAARLTAMQGAEVLFYPTAIGWHKDETDADRAQQKEAWRTMQRSHAIANGVFVAAINRVGVEKELTFWGSSFVVDPGGVVLAEASATEPEVLVVECDPGRIERIRRGWPFFRDRRIDAYGPLTRRLLD